MCQSEAKGMNIKMKILLHFPGKFHIEKEIDIEGSFYSIWVKFVSDLSDMKQYISMEAFFSRFMVYRNGTRLWNFMSTCENKDNLIIVAINKISNVSIAPLHRDKRIGCSQCEGVAIYVDKYNLLEENDEKREKAYCKECFCKKILQKAYRNIEKIEYIENYIIDIGLSGERDSTIAAYLLMEFIKEKKLKVEVIGVYNNIGLGYYDEEREKSAIITAKNLGINCKINYVDIGMLDEVCNQNVAGEMRIDFCKMCTYLSGWRDVGAYEGKMVISVTGSNTLEDEYVSKLYGAYMEEESKVLNKIHVLQGMSEDIVALYGAIKNIDYCVEDCPIQCSSPHYFCRKIALNPLKAISPWVYKTKDVFKNLIEEYPFGLISNKKTIKYFSKTIKRTDGKWVDLTQITVGNSYKIFNDVLEENDQKVNELEKRYFKKRVESEYQWIEKRGKILIENLHDDLIKKQTLELNPDFSFLSTEYVLLYKKHSMYDLKLKEISILEQRILNLFKNKKTITIGEILAMNSEIPEDKLGVSICKLLLCRIIVFNQTKKCIRENKMVVRKIAIYDKNKFLKDAVFSRAFDLEDIEIIYNMHRTDVGIDQTYNVFISDEFNELQQYEKENCARNESMYVHIANTITIMKGSIERFLEKFEPYNWENEGNNEGKIEYFFQNQIIMEILNMVIFDKDSFNCKHPNDILLINRNNREKNKISF